MLQVFSLHSLLLFSLSFAYAQGYSGTTPGSGAGIGLSPSFEQAEFLVNITLGGQTFNVVLDTGSSDLWVQSPAHPLKINNDSGLFGADFYGTGNISGPIQFAELRIGEYTIPSQAFINANRTADQPYDGILGVGFDINSQSVIELAIKTAWGNDSTLGNTTFTNILAQNPSLPPFFDISLQRIDEYRPGPQGMLTFGAHEPDREAVAQAPRFNNTVPERWTVFVDGMTVNGRNVPFNVSSLSTAPAGKLVALMDTGTTDGRLPDTLVNEIYGSIPGAILADDVWLIPCVGAANVSFIIGGVEFPVHPLDLSIVLTTHLDPDDDTSSNTTRCITRYISADTLGLANDGLDMILGSAFLKNAYVSYNYGADVGRTQSGAGSYIQALPTTNRDDAWTDFLISRTQALQQMPPLIDPAILVEIIDASNSESDNTTASPAPSASVSASASAPTQSGTSDASRPAAAEALADVESTPSSNSDDVVASLLHKYGPIVIGLLGANIAIMVVLCAIALGACMRGALRSGAKTRSISPNYAPVPFKERLANDDAEFTTPVHNYGE